MVNKSKKIQSEISAGELLDKISILEIKHQKITNKDNLYKVKKEYELLKQTQKSCIDSSDKINDLFNSIKEVNLTLWNIEDQIRVCEKNKDFGKKFIELARGVYVNNDKRSKIKLEINKVLGSNITEVKQYEEY